MQPAACRKYGTMSVRLCSTAASGHRSTVKAMSSHVNVSNFRRCNLPFLIIKNWTDSDRQGKKYKLYCVRVCLLLDIKEHSEHGIGADEGDADLRETRNLDQMGSSSALLLSVFTWHLLLQPGSGQMSTYMPQGELRFTSGYQKECMQFGSERFLGTYFHRRILLATLSQCSCSC